MNLCNAFLVTDTQVNHTNYFCFKFSGFTEINFYKIITRNKNFRCNSAQLNTFALSFNLLELFFFTSCPIRRLKNKFFACFDTEKDLDALQPVDRLCFEQRKMSKTKLESKLVWFAN